MLKSLSIKNFQSHKDTLLDFSPNLTVITGHNNNGKSVIFRALYKAIRNKPDGQSFVRDFEDICTVVVETDKGMVTRQVKKNGASDANKYIINRAEDEADEEYVKFSRTGIPEEVKSCLGVTDIVDFGDVPVDLNFQLQNGDPPLLMSGRGVAGIRGKVLGRVIGIDTVQKAIQNTSLLEKREVRRINELESSTKVNKKTLEKYAYVDALIEQRKALETQLTLIQNKELECSELVDQKNQLQNINKEAKDLKQLVYTANSVKKVDRDYVEERISLKEDLEQLFIVDKNYKTQEFLVSKLPTYNIEMVKSKVILLEELKALLYIEENLKVQENLQNQIDTILVSVRTVAENINKKLEDKTVLVNLKLDAEGKQLELQKQDEQVAVRIADVNTVKKELEELKDTLKICPTCGAPSKYWEKHDAIHD